MDILEELRDPLLISLLEQIPPDLKSIEEYLQSAALSPKSVSVNAILFIYDFCQFEYGDNESLEQYHGNYLKSVLEILLRHGLQPNGIYDTYNVMQELYLVDTGYSAADCMSLLLENGGDLYLKLDGDILFDEIEFNVIFDAINQDNRSRFDQLIHLWLVMVGHGAISRTKNGDRKPLWSVYDIPSYYGQGPFNVASLKDHRKYTWALTHIPRNGENWSLHIIDKATGWEVLRL